MRAAFGLCRWPLVGALALGVFAFALSAEGQEIRWQPVDATGNKISTVDTPPEIVLSRGGVTVMLFMEMSGWDPDTDGIPTLGAWQGTLDAATLDGPGDCDLVPVGAGTGNGFEGAFQAVKVCGNMACVVDPQAVDCVWDESSCCTSLPIDACGPCPTGSFCVDRPDYVYFQMDNTPTVSTATPNYAWSAASTACATDPDAVTRFYGGTLLLEVPDLCCPPWDVGFDPDSNYTLFNKCDGPLIPFAEGGIIPGRITMERGSCCYGIGTDDPGCEEDLCQFECDLKPEAKLPIRVGVGCEVECAECIIDFDCMDPYDGQTEPDNYCTFDECDNNICEHTDLFEFGVECCDPETGDSVPIDDGNVCTDCTCDEETGEVTCVPNADSCNDGNGCTHSDICGGGVCEGQDINETACTTPGPAGTDQACDFGDDGSYPCEYDPLRQGLYCKCSLCTPLIVKAVDSEIKDDNCYEAGETVVVKVSIGPGSERVTGAQFTLDFDPTCLQYEGMGPCLGSVFNVNPYKVAQADNVFYVSLIEPFKRCSIDGNICFDDNDCWPPDPEQTCDLTTGSKGPADLACATFTKLVDDCDKCPICLSGMNPENILLTNDEGYSVFVCPELDCDAIRLAGDLSITVPDDSDYLVQADCGLTTANVTWDTPFATDTCDDPEPQVVCGGEWLNIFDLPDPVMGPDDLVWNGGDFPQGHWWFVCDAENSCGNTVRETWTVYVKDQHMLDVEVELGPPMTLGRLTRCICFQLYANCWDMPDLVCMEMMFGPPENFKRHARGQVKVAKNNYMCITAVDPLHTLRQSSDIACVGNAWTALWKGDPLLGGNWLPGGNLDSYKAEGVGSPYVIDVLDFGKFMNEISNGAIYVDAEPTPGSTDCMMEGPHGDINGDGFVDQIDYGIIQMNFLMAKKNECCPDRAAEPIVPVTEITVKELRQAGMIDLIVADLNKDGVLNIEDMETYEAGVRPVQTERIRKHGTR